MADNRPKIFIPKNLYTKKALFSEQKSPTNKCYNYACTESPLHRKHYFPVVLVPNLFAKSITCSNSNFPQHAYMKYDYYGTEQCIFAYFHAHFHAIICICLRRK